MRASAERDDLVRRLYQEGASQSEISRRIGVSRQRLYQLMDELKIRKRKRPTPEQRVKQVARLIRSGMTGRQIADHFGVGHAAIYRDIGEAKQSLTKADLARYHENRYATLRARAGQRDPRFKDQIDKRRARLPTLIERGWSLGRIADKFGVTGQTIRNDLLAIGTTKRLEEQIHANRVAESRKTRARNARARRAK